MKKPILTKYQRFDKNFGEFIKISKPNEKEWLALIVSAVTALQPDDGLVWSEVEEIIKKNL
jgi:hypothetical protein